MNTPEKISPDDPRLTLYALGEMDAAERASFERQLQHDAAARAAVEEIRRTAAALGAALAAEPAPAAGPATAEAVIPGWTPARSETDREQPRDKNRRGGSKLLRFPSLYYSVAGLAAAAFAVLFVVRESQDEAQRAKRQMSEFDGAVATAAAPPPPAAVAMPAPLDRASADESARREDRSAAAKAAMAAERRAKQRMTMVAAEANVPDQFVATAERATATFPLRVGRDSYAQVRAQLKRGERPARASVQVAEMINAFDYTWPAAEAGAQFATLLEETAAPWSQETRLVRVGVKGLGERGAIVARSARAAVEFNPERVRAWRLIGFEREGDAMGVQGLAPGETMRGGDTVTALYEILPVADASPAATLAALVVDYQVEGSPAPRQLKQRLAPAAAPGSFAQASADMKFATAVAAFGLALRESPMQAAIGFGEIARWAEAGAGDDEARRELVELVHAAETFVR